MSRLLKPQIFNFSLYKGQDIENLRESTLQAFFNHLKKRAFAEGYAAYKNNECRHAPARLDVYAGSWTEGYDQAALDKYHMDKRTKP